MIKRGNINRQFAGELIKKNFLAKRIISYIHKTGGSHTLNADIYIYIPIRIRVVIKFRKSNCFCRFLRNRAFSIRFESPASTS